MRHLFKCHRFTPNFNGVAPDLQQTLTLLPLICDKKVVSLPLI